MNRNIPTPAEAEVILAKMVEQKLLTNDEARGVRTAWRTIRGAGALEKAGQEAQIVEKLNKVLAHLSKGLDLMQDNLSDVDRRLSRLEHQTFDRHVEAQSDRGRAIH